jgi:N-acetylmuramoyl-L-alanine amidase
MAKANWLEFYRGEGGKVHVVSWNDDKPLTSVLPQNRAELISILSSHNGANNVLVAPPGKTLPKIPQDGAGVLAGKFVVIDPGHSEKKPGARGKNGVEEEDLNRLQANVVAGLLRDKGAKVEIVDPEADDLIEIGKRACASDMFLSLHHNAFDSKQHYVCVMVHKRLASSVSRRFASICAEAISKKLGLPLFQSAAGLPGVMEAGLSVLNSAETSNPSGPCVLVESYFVDALSDIRVAEAMTIDAGHAIAEAAEEWMSPA